MKYNVNIICKLLLVPFLLVCNTVFADVYRWVDENGRVHFGDKKHETKSNKIENLSERYAQPSLNFEVTIIPISYNLPLDTKNKITIAVKKIFYILNEYNKIPFNENTSITVKLFGNHHEYKKYQREISTSRSTTGFYSVKNNEAVVWKNSSVKSMMRVITHEAFHTILRTNYKSIPTWLNEGFAEYFEQIEVFGTTAAIGPNKGWEKVIKQALYEGSAPSLPDYLALNGKQWRQLNQNENLAYAMGWSLSFYLMSSKDGRKLIAEIFNERKKSKEAVVVDIVEKNYAGGLAKLESNWGAWLYARKNPHRY